MRTHRLLLALAMLALTACSTIRVKPAGGPDPMVQHVVLVELDDPALAPAMLKDMQDAFPNIPTLRHWSAGPHIDTGRANVLHWYTLGVLTQFDSVADYQAYLKDARHEALVKKWKPHWKRAEMFDFGSVETAPAPAAK